MKKILIGLLACTLFGACESDDKLDYPVYVKDASEGYEGYKLVWQEEFDTAGLLAPEDWDYEEGGNLRNEEYQYYKKADADCSRIEEGKLTLEARKSALEADGLTYDYTSASVLTKREFEYGRLDIAVKIPIGRGIWPSLRLIPVDTEDKDTYIHPMEYVFSGDDGQHPVYSTLQTPAMKRAGRNLRVNTTSFNIESRFHLYSVIWEERRIDILFDNEVILTYEKTKDDVASWPFDQPFRLAISLAVGGNWGGIYGVAGSIFPCRMQVDYIRYYQPDDNEENKLN